MLASAINVHSRAIMVDVFLVCHLQLGGLSQAWVGYWLVTP